MKILRQPSTDNGTFGEWFDDNNSHLCFTIERPVTGAHPRINNGTYTFNAFTSPTKGDVWLRDDAAANDGRTMIEIHIANKSSELLGCVAPGMSIGTIDGIPAVLSSHAAFAMLKSTLPDSFELTFEDAPA